MGRNISTFLFHSYAMPTKSTEISQLQEKGTKMNVEAVILTHERIVQVLHVSSLKISQTYHLKVIYARHFV